MKNYFKFLVIALLLNSVVYGQEVVTLSGYNGSPISVTATSNVNETITIVFEDVDIIQNFYTQFQNSIFMYGGLDTGTSQFVGAPDFNDLLSQPELVLIDADNNAQPNTYSITINLAQHYASVPNGTPVVGLNLLFQNQFGGGGNNQTADLYIDLADANKDDTLSLTQFDRDNNIFFVQNELFINGYSGQVTITVYDTLGKLVKQQNETVTSSNFRSNLNLTKNQLYIVTLRTDQFVKTLKVISN